MSLEIRVVLAAFAVFRLAQLITIDDGPWDMFFHLRVLAGVYDRDKTGRASTNIGRLFACPYCIGVWLSALALIPVFFSYGITDALVMALGIAGMQSALQDVSSGKG